MIRICAVVRFSNTSANSFNDALRQGRAYFPDGTEWGDKDATKSTILSNFKQRCINRSIRPIFMYGIWKSRRVSTPAAFLFMVSIESTLLGNSRAGSADGALLWPCGNTSCACPEQAAKARNGIAEAMPFPEKHLCRMMIRAAPAGLPFFAVFSSSAETPAEKAPAFCLRHGCCAGTQPRDITYSLAEAAATAPSATAVTTCRSAVSRQSPAA